MKITILCNSEAHPVNDMLNDWVASHALEHDIDLVRKTNELSGGDLLFLISCSEIVTKELREKYQKSLVIHASDLPKGRGWSPHVWDIVQGAEQITVTLLEAEDKVDTGKIWKKINCKIPKDTLYDEINSILFDAESRLMDYAVENFDTIEPMEQKGEPTYHVKRTPKNSQLDVDKSLKEQFDLLRVCDTERFPAFFNIHGYRYEITLKKTGGKNE